MRILVFGAGAVGSLIGGVLSTEHEVTLVGRRAHADAINRRGLRISGITTRIAWPTATTEVPQDTPEAILVTTKAYDTKHAVEALRAFWGQSLFVTLQNGLGNAEAIAAMASRVLAGTTTLGVLFVAPGEVVHTGLGETAVGPFAGAGRPDAQAFADVLSSVGLATRVVDDARPELWTKAIVNAAINPLTAILRRQNGELVRREDLRGLLAGVVHEGVAATARAGIRLGPDSLVAKAEEVATRTAENRSSMLQDVERGRRTEVDAIVGELLRAAGNDPSLYYLNALRALVAGIERTSVGGS